MQKISYRKHRYFQNRVPFSLRGLGQIPSSLFLAVITLYQWTLSPDHGILSLYTVGQCKFRPTCSEYTKMMIKKYGVTTGSKRGLKQIRQCL